MTIIKTSGEDVEKGILYTVNGNVTVHYREEYGGS